MRRPIRWIAIMLCLAACNGAGPELPRGYRELAVPRDRLASPPARERGRALYLEHCALCHGERADGRGPRRGSLATAPADFTDPSWRSRQGPRRLFRLIRQGVPGTPMPGWPALTDGETWDLVAYLLSVHREGA